MTLAGNLRPQNLEFDLGTGGPLIYITNEQRRDQAEARGIAIADRRADRMVQPTCARGTVQIFSDFLRATAFMQ